MAVSVLAGTAAEDLDSWGNPVQVIKLLKPGRHSVDAKNGAQDRCDTEKNICHISRWIELTIPRLERTVELCQRHGRRHFHSRVDSLRAQKYRADLARNRVVAIKIAALSHWVGGGWDSSAAMRRDQKPLRGRLVMRSCATED
jgi:hypothetical protein